MSRVGLEYVFLLLSLDVCMWLRFCLCPGPVYFAPLRMVLSAGSGVQACAQACALGYSNIAALVISLVGPTAVKAVGATKTVANLQMGRQKEQPRECLPKRNYLREGECERSPAFYIARVCFPKHIVHGYTDAATPARTSNRCWKGLWQTPRRLLSRAL